MRRSHGWRVAWLSLAAAALVGCGRGSGGEPGAASPASVPADVAAALRTCMRDAGFPQFERRVGRPGEDPLWDREDFSSAYDRCQVQSGLDRLAPKEGHQGPSAEEQNRKTLAMVSCLRGRGWDLPDPTTSAQGALVPRFPDLGGDAEKESAFRRDVTSCGQSAGVEVRDGEGDGDHAEGTEGGGDHTGSSGGTSGGQR